MKRLFLFLLIFVFAFGDGLHIMTEEYPPYNYTADGNLTGISTEVVQEIQRRVGSKDQIEVLPWTRAYKTIQLKPKTALYSMAKTDARINLFKWVGPIAKDSVCFFKKRGSDIKVSSIEDAMKVQAIGVATNSSGHILLSAKGFTNLDAVPDATLNIRKLMLGRVQLVPSVEVVIKNRAKLDGIDPQMLESTGVCIDEQLLYIAFSLDVSDELISRWQKALDDMKSDGTFDRIYGKYSN